jgi:hypothetical protein
MAKRTSRIVPITREDDTEFLIEVSEVESVAGRQKVAATDAFDSKDLANSVTAISRMFVNALKEVSPDKLSVEFGVEATLKAGKLLALLCDGEGKANLKITLEWSKSTAKK